VNATLALDPAWLTTALLLSLRLAGALVATPILAPASVPLPVRVLVVFGLSLVLALGMPGTARPVGLSGLVAAASTELALGATLGLGILLAFAAISMAGQLVGVEIGFGLGQVIDPSSNASMPVVASAFQQLGLLVFFGAAYFTGALDKDLLSQLRRRRPKRTAADDEILKVE